MDSVTFQDPANVCACRYSSARHRDVSLVIVIDFQTHIIGTCARARALDLWLGAASSSIPALRDETPAPGSSGRACQSTEGHVVSLTVPIHLQQGRWGKKTEKSEELKQGSCVP